MSFHIYQHKNGIKFRKIEEFDLTNLLALKNESWFGTHTVTIANAANQINWFKSLCNEDVSCPKNLVLIAMTQPQLDNTDRAVGVFKILHIDWQSRRADVGWDIYEEYRGQGLGKKIVKAGVDFCFEMLNLRRLNADILETNSRSKKCAIEAGFDQEGRQRKAIFKQTGYVDNLLYGILKEE